MSAIGREKTCRFNPWSPARVIVACILFLSIEEQAGGKNEKVFVPDIAAHVCAG
jgi:hypothetical protein